MATKKMKRALGAAKRHAFEEEVRLSGLKAQAEDIRRREARARQRAEQDEAEARKKEETRLEGLKAVADARREEPDNASIEQECI